MAKHRHPKYITDEKILKLITPKKVETVEDIIRKAYKLFASQLLLKRESDQRILDEFFSTK